MIINRIEFTNEFDYQVNNLLQKQYPQAAGISPDEFVKQIEPLRNKLEKLIAPQKDLENGKLPFVIVITNELIDSEKTMSLVERDGKKGVTILRPHTSQNFRTIKEVNIPNKKVYLLVDIDRGKENSNLPPNEAMKLIKNANRSPLTIDEGIAIVTQFPEFLMKNHCFSLLASRII